VAGEEADVDAEFLRFQAGEVVAEGEGAAAVGAFEDGGDALADEVFGGGVAFEAGAGVAVGVDEAGGECQPLGVDRPFRGHLLGAAEGEDAALADGDVAHVGGAARAVDDAGAPNEGVTLKDSGRLGVGSGLERECRSCQKQDGEKLPAHAGYCNWPPCQEEPAAASSGPVRNLHLAPSAWGPRLLVAARR